jgi:lycopene beta-cyclase
MPLRIYLEQIDLTKNYDIVVIGAGLSSLMFLSRYILNNKNQSILLIEKKNKNSINQTFCIWQGPGLINIQKTYHLKPRYIWNKIEVSYENKSICKNIRPYTYQCFDGKETLKNLLKQCKGKIDVKQGLDVLKIKNNKNSIEIICSNLTIHSKYLIDSRNTIEKKQYEFAPSLRQAFIGNEIISETEKFNPQVLKLMEFIKNKKDIQFTYTLPFSKNKALVETTIFSKKPSFFNIKKLQKQALSQYKKFKSIKEEKGVIPMTLYRELVNNNNLPIGLPAGMARPSTGYSMMRIAQWVNSIEKKKIKNNNIEEFQFQPNNILNWFDSIFLTVCFFWPHRVPSLFMRLFGNADIKSIIRFMSDAPTSKDIIFIILSMPKKHMIQGLIRKYVK